MLPGPWVPGYVAGAVPLPAGGGRGCLARSWRLLGLLWSVIPGRARGHAGRGILCSPFAQVAWHVRRICEGGE